MEKPNIVILTLGRCGSTIVARMLTALGWRLPPDADEYAEPVLMREMNDRIIRGQEPDHDEYYAAARALPAPWVAKDPRFVLTLERWADFMPGALLLYLTRDLDRVEQSLRRAGWGKPGPEGYTLRGVALPVLAARAAGLYTAWPGPKLEVGYERIREAVKLFDTTRG